MTEELEQSTMNEMPYDESADRVETIMEDMLLAARVEAVYGEPIEHGDQLIIPAAEIMSVAGFGMGSGYGSGPDDENGKQQGQGGGSGGGGGGRVLARPVAVIVASPGGVEVKPVFDMTKIWMAALTALGFVIAARAGMRRGRIHKMSV